MSIYLSIYVSKTVQDGRIVSIKVEYEVVCRNIKIFTCSRGHCTKMLTVNGSEPILFCTPRGPLVSAPTHLRAAPYILAPGPPGRPTSKKVFPKFRKNLRGGGQYFECAKRRPPRAIRGKILATVPEKNQKKIPKFSRKSTISRVTRKFYQPKRYKVRALDPPISGPKCTRGL